MAIYASNNHLITKAEMEMEEAFKISRLGDLKQLLGIEICRDWDAHTITLTQSQIIKTFKQYSHSHLDETAKLVRALQTIFL
jgi:hypothetical protein